MYSKLSEPSVNDTSSFGTQPAETTPLIPKPSTAAKRVRSGNATFSFMAKRRLRTNFRSLKSSDRPQFSNIKVDYGDFSDETSRSTTPLSLGANYSNDDTTLHSTCEVVNQDTLQVGSTRKPNKQMLPQVSLTLENTGSVARDHLASERTFLAYMRTSLALASSGVALVQLFTVASASSSGPFHPGKHRLHKYIRPLGATTIFMGIIVLFIGVWRYFSVQTALTKGQFPAARLVTSAIAFAMTILVVLTFIILLAGKLEPKGLGF